MDSPPQPVPVQHDAARRRFELPLDGAPPAFLSYTLAGHRASYDHTYVPNTQRGRGLAAVLVRAALEEARRRHWRVIPRCSYVARFLERHPEFRDLLDTRGLEDEYPPETDGPSDAS